MTIFKKIPCEMYELTTDKGIFIVTFKPNREFNVEYKHTHSDVFTTFCYGSYVDEGKTNKDVLLNIQRLAEETDYFDDDIEVHMVAMES